MTRSPLRLERSCGGDFDQAAGNRARAVAGRLFDRTRQRATAAAARLVLAACGAAAAAGGGAHAEETQLTYRIPPGDAADVIGAIADASGQAIVFPYDELAHRASDGVTGVHSVQEALNIALRGTGYTAVATPRYITVVAGADARAEPAEEAIAPEPAAAADDNQYPSSYQRVVVTGTRITASGMDTPVPVTVITRDDLERLSPITLMDAANQLPQLVNNATPESTIGWSGSAGQSFLNLRGLGSNRTLILIDGRRLVPSTRRGTLDIGLLPEALVDRVEIVTGGASAAYGSDAVAGVVNFILDKRYQGFGGHVQAGVSERGDYRNYEASLSGGVQLSPNLHLLVAADHYSNEGVRNAHDRDWHRSWGLIANRDPSGPTWLIAPDVVSSTYSYGGLIPSGPLAGTQFLPGGVAAPFVYGDNRTSSTMIGGDGVDVGRDRLLSPEVERNNGFFYLTRSIGPDVTVYLQGLHGHTKAVFDRSPSYISGLWEATIYIDNPYIPDDVRQRMADAGVDSFPLSRFASQNDLGAGDITTQNWTTSLTAGVDATLRDWRLAAYYQYGANTQHIDFRNAIRVDRVYRAMDAVRDPADGAIVCRSTLSFPDDGCVPTSFLGDGAVTEEAKAWIRTDNRQVQKLSQHFVEISVDGEPFRTPAGGVAAALGASVRIEDFEQFNTPFTAGQDTPTAAEAGYRGLPEIYSDGYPLVERATSAASNGASTVSEIFAETIVPLAADLPLVRSLDAQAALRFANYEGSGDIWAWKAGLDWRVTDGLRLRTTASRDVRGGTLAERFDRSSSGATARDPFLAGAPTYSFGVLQNGNPAVRPERADTLTAGVVYRPHWLKGLEFSADYYDVRIHDAISRPDPQTIINRCYAGETEFCDYIQRTQSGAISIMTSTFLNIDEARTRGVDLEAGYETSVNVLFDGQERLAFRAIAAVYAEASVTTLAEGRVDYVGQVGPGPGVPDYRLMGSTTYASERMSINLTATYVSGGRYNRAFAEGVDINDNTVEGVLYMNARAAWRFDTARGPVEVYANVRNLLDRDPPVAPTAGGGFYGANHAPSSYDTIGRRFTIGLAWQF